MRISTAIGSTTGTIRRGYVCVILCSVALASCSRTGGTSLVPAGLPNAGASALLNAASGLEPSLSQKLGRNKAYKELYAFNGASGMYPTSGLIAVNGELYGTTALGGGTPCISGLGCGTVFKVSSSGKESVIYRFKGGSSDGANPYAGLIAVNGTLYGTTQMGGESGDGTVFKVSTSGQESVLHAFTGGTDGWQPWAALIAVKGELYGTTIFGGAGGGGTVFKVSTSGKESVLHSFTNGADDGAEPYASLTAFHGVLYGTTYEGGAVQDGIVFTLSTSGNESVLYNFTGTSNGDGSGPRGGLTVLHGALYGTTISGGANGYGTVFEMTTSGQEHIISSDIYNPISNLITLNGALYGTSPEGHPSGRGNVFKLSTSGKETVLYSFGPNPDGGNPQANLIAVNGMLYGTTEGGGPDNDGTVFKVSP